MSLTAISLFEWVRAKLLMNSTHNMCKNLESNVFGLGSVGRNESNSNLLAGIGEKKIFHELDVYHVVGLKRFWVFMSRR